MDTEGGVGLTLSRAHLLVCVPVFGLNLLPSVQYFKKTDAQVNLDCDQRTILCNKIK